LEVESAQVAADGSLVVQWSPENVSATYHPGWLRHVADGQHLPSSWLPNPVAWTASVLSEPPTHDGANVFTDPEVLRAWGDDLMRYGISRLANLGTDRDFGLKLAKHLEVAVRDTNFGLIWDVKADITMAGSADTNSTANSNLRLGPHTDLPTRETPPGFQFLHCVVNETEGGLSTMADGLAVADELQTSHPEHYEALCTLRWVFFNRGPGIDHRWSGPMIDHGVDGSPLTFRAFYPVRGFPDMDPEDMPRAYAAMKVFSQLAAQERFRIAYPFTPGDMVGFDNRRILHGRDEFSSGGKRHLRGMYIDQDEVRSFVRVANRREAALKY
jgi:gamma-butyrobetaine dioxygenase